MLIAPWLYSAAAFIPIFNLVDAFWWAVAMILVGLFCLVGAGLRQADIARIGMVGSAGVTIVLGFGLTIGLCEIWYDFVQTLGWTRLETLLFDHPSRFPLALLSVTAAPPSPVLALLLLSVAVKDFTICAQPLRVPTEDRIELDRVREA
jgi:hypothetical protein